MIWGLYDASIAVVSPLLFWDLTPAEIQSLVDAETRRRDMEHKNLISILGAQSNHLIEGVAYVLGSIKTPPEPLPKSFPELFDSPSSEQDVDRQLAEHKANFLEYARQHNAARRGQDV